MKQRIDLANIFNESDNQYVALIVQLHGLKKAKHAKFVFTITTEILINLKLIGTVYRYGSILNEFVNQVCRSYNSHINKHKILECSH